MIASIFYSTFFTKYLWICAGLTAGFLVVHVVPYLLDKHHIRRNGITGPFLAMFSDAWLGWVAAQGRRAEVVHEKHKKYGKFVRLAPNHVSIADPEAIGDIYGHGNGTLKTDFYDAFISIGVTVFTTRSREEHTRKRKVISHGFSQKSVSEFEPYIRLHVSELFEQWDELYDGGRKGLTGVEGEGGWKGHDGRVWFNAMPWCNYLAFDIISDLAFALPFGMLRNAKDAALTAVDQKAAMSENGQVNTDMQDIEKPVVAVREVPAVKVLNGRSEYSASMGVLPPWWRPIVRLLPWYADGSQDVEDLAGLAVAAVAKRLAIPTDRTDLLSKLQQGRHEDGRPLNREELTADALTQLIAGSDTTANSSCAVLYHIISSPRVQAKLQKELDEALASLDDPVASYDLVKHLPYLDAVIHEGLRVHSTSGNGLPRLVPEGGLTVCGKWFPAGTVLSAPTYTIHRDPKVWGEDADVFRPERWLERGQATLLKAFNTFSYGPRACIGRNVATMELFIIVSSIFRRYEFVLEEPHKPLEVHEGFIRKPMACRVGMKRRNV
ncbi:cytochrome P450 monooxygenase pc-bph [Fomitiporia mediterranea MF3/22]|uniref:Cytochrome P450 monooxygenase pc-bph n=1 Tax=Fomitiporia mediterranea (strain MF3/22) TaxID=694068 RepID=R7SH67_FOMME|nr:cytochrome P450 monooxygenase pc-bph [Fomitiporia mediterranea MF3/22]EJC97642.1 cytochrome P450 monooxygenase pc-bph [Fomitiporia mediterranea MF3/22]